VGFGLVQRREFFTDVFRQHGATVLGLGTNVVSAGSRTPNRNTHIILLLFPPMQLFKIEQSIQHGCVRDGVQN
jgi:hypothetical protein